MASQDAIAQLRDLMEEAIIEDLQLGATYKNLHQGYPDVVIQRILKARDNNVSKAFKMLMDCLHWRMNDDIDNILSKLIEPKELYDAIRESYLIGMTGLCKQVKFTPFRHQPQKVDSTLNKSYRKRRYDVTKRKLVLPRHFLT